MLLFGALVWMNRNSCDQKLGNTRQDGGSGAVCNSLMLLYSQNIKKKRGSNEIFILEESFKD